MLHPNFPYRVFDSCTPDRDILQLSAQQCTCHAFTLAGTGTSQSLRRRSRSLPQYPGIATLRLRCRNLVFELDNPQPGRRQRFLDRAKPSTRGRKFDAECGRLLPVGLKGRPVFVVHPFELGFPVPHFAARLVDLQQAVFSQAIELDEAGRLLLGRTGETEKIVR